MYKKNFVDFLTKDEDAICSNVCMDCVCTEHCAVYRHATERMNAYFNKPNVVLVSGQPVYYANYEDCWTYAKENGHAHYTGVDWVLYPDVAITTNYERGY